MSCGLVLFSTVDSAAQPKVIAHVLPNEQYTFLILKISRTYKEDKVMLFKCKRPLQNYDLFLNIGNSPRE
jgi:hypothetical protein